MIRIHRVGVGLMCLGLWSGAVHAQQAVQVRETDVRVAPSFLSEILSSLTYGAPVSVLEERSGWARISTADNVTGWIHRSALGRPRSTLRAGTGTVDTSATGDELALAGKGFSADVEQAYRAKNAELDFQWVDRMEKLEMTPEEIRRFLAQGGLRSTLTGGQP